MIKNICVSTLFRGASEAIGRGLTALLKDESGLTTVEYTTMGGVLSGVIVVAASALRDAQAVALDQMIQPQ